MTKFEIEERIIEVVKTVYDPEIPVNIYDLGLIVFIADFSYINSAIKSVISWKLLSWTILVLFFEFFQGIVFW